MANTDKKRLMQQQKDDRMLSPDIEIWGGTRSSRIKHMKLQAVTAGCDSLDSFEDRMDQMEKNVEATGYYKGTFYNMKERFERLMTIFTGKNKEQRHREKVLAFYGLTEADIVH